MDELEDAELEMTIDLIEEELLTKRGLLVQRSAFCYTGAAFEGLSFLVLTGPDLTRTHALSTLRVFSPRSRPLQRGGCPAARG